MLDNSITGMTGHQNNPANGYTISGDPTVAVDLRRWPTPWESAG